VSFFPLTAVRMACFAPGLELWASSMFIPWFWKTLGFLRWKWGGDEEGICTSLICENQDFSVFAYLFFPLTAVRMAYLLMDVELLAWWMSIPWFWKTLGFLRWRWGGWSRGYVQGWSVRIRIILQTQILLDWGYYLYW
jgi:hypothetical protein